MGDGDVLGGGVSEEGPDGLIRDGDEEKQMNVNAGAIRPGGVDRKGVYDSTMPEGVQCIKLGADRTPLQELGLAIAEALGAAMETPNPEWDTQTAFYGDSLDLSSLESAMKSWVGPPPVGILGWIGQWVDTEAIMVAESSKPVQTYIVCRGDHSAFGIEGPWSTSVNYERRNPGVWNARNLLEAVHGHVRRMHAGEFMEEGAGIGAAYRAWLKRHRALKHVVTELYNRVGG